MVKKSPRKKPSQNLFALLEEIQVHGPDQWENPIGPKDWYAVSTPNDSIIAYFAYEEDAFSFRLNYINRVLNPVVGV